MERVTGSKGLAVAALVSLIIHGGFLLTYAFVFKGVGTLTNYEPLKVALIMPSELGEPVPALAKKERASSSKEDQSDAPPPVHPGREKEEPPPKAGTPAAKAEAEALPAPAPQPKDLDARDFASAALREQSPRFNPDTAATSAPAGVSDHLPSAGSSTAKGAGSGINLPGFQKVAAPGGEMSLPGYARLETSRSGALTSAAPRYNENSPPAYPLPARRRGYAGVVLLSVEVLADGRVGRLEMKKTSGYDLLDKSAQETVKGWKFSPGKKMGTPVTMWVDVPVRFQLN